MIKANHMAAVALLSMHASTSQSLPHSCAHAAPELQRKVGQLINKLASVPAFLPVALGVFNI